jgi:ABC-type long-subunit fatty acid transport system fused permease/ATPase subunit
MLLIAPVLMGIVLFYWLAFCFTVIAWLKVISNLCSGNFIRSSFWFNVGTAMVLWWTDKWESWDAFWPGAAVLVALGALGTFARCMKRMSQRRALMDAWATFCG